MKLTPWFAGDEKPVRVGVYERDTSNLMARSARRYVFSYWTGKHWCVPEMSPWYAEQMRGAWSANQSLPWRGIVKE